MDKLFKLLSFSALTGKRTYVFLFLAVVAYHFAPETVVQLANNSTVNEIAVSVFGSATVAALVAKAERLIGLYLALTGGKK